ncbi:MAG: tetratricopeptide repeat protein [Bacteroidota bacterium]
MKTRPLIACAFFLLFFLFIIQPICFAQKLGLEPEKWAIELAKAGLTELNSMGSLSLQLEAVDSSRALRFLDSLEMAGHSGGYFFKAHFCMIKAKYLYDKFAGYDKFKDRRAQALAPIKAQIIQLLIDAIQATYHADQDITIGWASFYSAKLMRNLEETGLAVMYAKNGVDLFEKVRYDVEPTVYTWLSELLYDIKEYDESYVNAQKAIASWAKIKDPEYNEKRLQQYHIRAWNAMGLNYFTKKNIDSAITHLQRALQIARHIKDTVWEAKVQGNMGQVLYQQNQFDSACKLFEKDYNASMAAGIYDNAASAAEWVARINLARGNTSTALAGARNAIALLILWPNRTFLRDNYYTLFQIFKAAKNYDSAFYYNDCYMALSDSLEKEVAISSLAISQAKLNDEVSKFNIQKLNQQKQSEVYLRNSIIVAILIAAFIALLIANRKLLTEKIKKQQAEKDRSLLKIERDFANEQLHMFTDNLVEKSNLIAALELKMSNLQSTAEQDAMLSGLGQLTILTEEDWSKFKQLFEKAYPGFFRKLIDQFPDITLAEQRMAAICKLNLSTREMAAMLGISNDSVRKTRQRLRSRIGLSNEISLEEHFST